jgi:translation initiation factor IF-3
MDYGKYKYEAAQKAKESRKKSTNVVVKEMKYRPKIGMGDFETKTKKVEQFLNEGHKVKVTIMFRGREMQHPELGRKILDQVAEAVTEVAKVEIYPRLDGRNMTMVLGPDKKAQAAAEKRRHTDDSATPATPTPIEPVATESVMAEPVASEPAATPIEATEPIAIDEVLPSRKPLLISDWASSTNPCCHIFSTLLANLSTRCARSELRPISSTGCQDSFSSGRAALKGSPVISRISSALTTLLPVC